jgi:hypothetical protein
MPALQGRAASSAKTIRDSLGLTNAAAAPAIRAPYAMWPIHQRCPTASFATRKLMLSARHLSGSRRVSKARRNSRLCIEFAVHKQMLMIGRGTRRRLGPAAVPIDKAPNGSRAA